RARRARRGASRPGRGGGGRASGDGRARPNYEADGGAGARRRAGAQAGKLVPVCPRTFAPLLQPVGVLPLAARQLVGHLAGEVEREAAADEEVHRLLLPLAGVGLAGEGAPALAAVAASGLAEVLGLRQLVERGVHGLAGDAAAEEVGAEALGAIAAPGEPAAREGAGVGGVVEVAVLLHPREGVLDGGLVEPLVAELAADLGGGLRPIGEVVEGGGAGAVDLLLRQERRLLVHRQRPP